MKHGRRRDATRAFFCLTAVLLFLFSAGSQAAEEPPPIPEKPAQPGEKGAGAEILTLEEAIGIALENHPRVKGARERVGAQKAVLGQEFSAYYPTIGMTNSYRTSNTTGGGDSTSDKAFDRFSGQASFNMTLYNFGKREGAVQSARDSVEATAHDFRTATNEVVLAVRQAYYGYLQAKALVRVREETVKDRELLVRRARGFYEVGTRPRIDVARAESNFFNARADLIAAQNAVKIAWVTLKNAVGVRDFPERPLTEELKISPVPISVEQARELALVSRPELKSFEAQRKAQDQKIAVARRGHLPDILLSASYGRQNTSREGDAFPLQPTWSVQLNLNIPIFEGFRSTYRVEESLRNYHALRAQEEDRKQQVALEVEQGYLKLIEAEERIKATEAALRAAKENLDLANGRYQVGVGSIIEITEAQTLYTDAQTNHIRSLFDYKIAEAQLVKAIGSQQP